MTGACDATYWYGISPIFLMFGVLARGGIPTSNMDADHTVQLCSQYNLIASFHFNGYFNNVSTSKNYEYLVIIMTWFLFRFYYF